MNVLGFSHLIVPLAIAVVVCLIFAALAAVVSAIVQLVAIGSRELAYRIRQRRRARTPKPLSRRR